MSSNITLTILFVASCIVISNIVLYIEIPKKRHPIRWIIVTNLILTFLICISILSFIRPFEFAMVMIFVLVCTVLVFLVNVILLRDYYSGLLISGVQYTSIQVLRLLGYSRIHELQVNHLISGLSKGEKPVDLFHQLQPLCEAINKTIFGSSDKRKFYISILRPLQNGYFEVITHSQNITPDRKSQMERTFFWRNTEQKSVTSIAGACIDQGELVLIDDIRNLDKVKQYKWVQIMDDEQGSMLAIPIKDDYSLNDSVKGFCAVLCITCTEPYFLTEKHVKQIEYLFVNKIVNMLVLYSLFPAIL